MGCNNHKYLISVHWLWKKGLIFFIASLPLTNFILVLGRVSRFVKRDLHFNKFRFGCTYLNMKKCVDLFALFFILAKMIVMCTNIVNWLRSVFVRYHGLYNLLNHLASQYHLQMTVTPLGSVLFVLKEACNDSALSMMGMSAQIHMGYMKVQYLME
jgi:hypothetical protein